MLRKCVYRTVILVLLVVLSPFGIHAGAAAPAPKKYGRQELVEIWRARIQSLLNAGQIPLVDLESSLKREDGQRYLNAAMQVMDELGVALIAFDGYQAAKTNRAGKGYRWGYYIQEIVNAHPDHFILATNGGTNNNWRKQKDDFIAQTEAQVIKGDYPIMGEFEFRHYLSSHECKTGRSERDVDIPLTGKNGRRLFALAAKTGIAFVIHLEPEDRPLVELEQMLGAYPKARVIWAHFGQIRHPDRQSQYAPRLLQRLLSAYPNLYIDISTGYPGRRYPCNHDRLDTVIWQDGILGTQKGVLKPEYRAILTQFSQRFVVGTDYGGGRDPLPEFLRARIKNVRKILRDLPSEARHNIGYRNAWFLLTGQVWR